MELAIAKACEDMAKTKTSIVVKLGVGMVFAIGKNFKSGSLNLPVNLVFMPGKEVQSSWYNEVDQSYTEYSYNSGARISLMVGFNLNK